jgi:serine protease
VLRLITGLSAVAAIGSVALTWSSAVAQAPSRIFAKQAALLGKPAPASAASKQKVARLIVKLRSSDMARSAMASGHVRQLSAMAGVGVKSVRSSGDASVVSLDAPISLSDAKTLAARLASDPMIEYAEPDLVLRPFLVPNDQDFTPRQWNLLPPTATYSGALDVTPAVPPRTAPAVGAINMPTAWDVTTGSSSVVVAVIDTGITNHPDLNGGNPALPYAPGSGAGVGNQLRFLLGYDFVSLDTIQSVTPTDFRANDGDGRDMDPTDPGDASTVQEKIDNEECDDGNPANQNTFHGTMTAGIIAANSNNTAGMAGIAWTVKVLPVRAIGKCGGSLEDMADAIRWASGTLTGGPAIPAANIAKVIYIGAGTAPGVACGPTLQGAIDAAINAGSVVIAPTGNHGELNISSPANCNGVISVTAHSINGESTQYANIGPNGGAGPNPTISAPGGGTPAVLGVTPGADGIDDPTWDGFYIWSTATPGLTPPGTGTINRTGTSLAAAQVAGVAALIKAKVPNATPVQVRGALTTSARPHPELSYCAPGRNRDNQCGIGLLDATRALQAAGPPVVVTPPVNVTVPVGGTASFTVQAIGVESYQWVRNGVNIAGATGPTYTTPALAATDNNVAFVVNMSNSFGGTTSPAAVVTVSGGGSNSPSGGGALPFWQLMLLSALLLAGRVRVAYRKQ